MYGFPFHCFLFKGKEIIRFTSQNHLLCIAASFFCTIFTGWIPLSCWRERKNEACKKCSSVWKHRNHSDLSTTSLYLSFFSPCCLHEIACDFHSHSLSVSEVVCSHWCRLFLMFRTCRRHIWSNAKASNQAKYHVFGPKMMVVLVMVTMISYISVSGANISFLSLINMCFYLCSFVHPFHNMWPPFDDVYVCVIFSCISLFWI